MSGSIFMIINNRPINASIAALLTATILAHSFSFLCLKYATLQSGLLAWGLIGCALCFMAARAIIWQRLLGLGDLSYLYPFTALVQLIILFYAIALFGESVTLGNLLGLGFMLAGAFFMTDE
jgi:drug/metabolite transporter (DMT)-like permease